MLLLDADFSLAACLLDIDFRHAEILFTRHYTGATQRAAPARRGAVSRVGARIMRRVTCYGAAAARCLSDIDIGYAQRHAQRYAEAAARCEEADATRTLARCARVAQRYAVIRSNVYSRYTR